MIKIEQNIVSHNFKFKKLLSVLDFGALIIPDILSEIKTSFRTSVKT